MTIFVTYLPVLHQGYLRAIEEIQPDQILLIDSTIYQEHFPELRKDLRAMDVRIVLETLKALYPKLEIEVFSPEIITTGAKIAMSTDALSRYVASTFLAGQQIEWHSTFLRWDKERILQPQVVLSDLPPSITSTQDIFAKLQVEAQLSSDWWRQVAAAVIQGGEVLQVAHNRHTPSEFEPYYFGDTRSFFHKGEYVELNTSLHAEAAVIGAAAKKGQSLAGAELYVTTFPCPYCARLIAHSGIKSVFYAEGYSMLDGAECLQEKGVVLHQIKQI